jgi:hypothetical protein
LRWIPPPADDATRLEVGTIFEVVARLVFKKQINPLALIAIFPATLGGPQPPFSALILIASRSCMLFASFAENSRVSRLFPPRQRRAFHEAVLDEILQERVVSSRTRRNFRGVKRKMSNFPLRPRTYKSLPRIDIKKAIRILK